MAARRVTRSQVESLQTPTNRPFPLSELDFSRASNTIEDDIVVSELKGLKAAYRGALGIAKRGKKARNKRKDHHQITVEEIHSHDASNSTLRDDMPEAIGILPGNFITTQEQCCPGLINKQKTHPSKYRTRVRLMRRPDEQLDVKLHRSRQVSPIYQMYLLPHKMPLPWLRGSKILTMFPFSRDPTRGLLSFNSRRSMERSSMKTTELIRSPI